MFFEAKNFKPDRPDTAFQGFSVTAFATQLDRADPERFLCPVRALKFYIDRTNGHRQNRKRLFLPIRETASGDITANSVSSWIRNAVKLAYIAADENAELRKLHNIRAHELRAIASSWDALKHVSFQDIIRLPIVGDAIIFFLTII